MNRATGLVVLLGASLALVTGCATTQGRADTAGFDVLHAHTGHGEITVVPASGLMFDAQSGSTEDVRVVWTLAHDVSPNRLLVFSRNTNQLIANVSAADVDLEHLYGPLPTHHARAKAPVMDTSPVADPGTPEAIALNDENDICELADEVACGAWNRAPSIDGR
jgi:hypothetical protein